MTNAIMLKNGTQVCSGRNCWANAKARGDVIQLTFMTGMKPALTVARTWWKVLAPAITAIDVKYTVFWIGDICVIHDVSFPCSRVRSIILTHDKIAEKDLQYLCLQAGPAGEEPLKDTDQDVSQWRANECAVDCHLGHSRADIVTMFAAIMGDPGC